MTTITLDNRPVHLYFGRDIDSLNITPEMMHSINSLPHKVVMCSSWDELPGYLKEKPTSICFSQTELEYSSALDIVNMVRTLCKLVDAPSDILIAVDIGKSTKHETIKMLQKSGIFGIIPRACDFGWDECEKGGNALWSKIPYWPKHILDQLPGANPAKKLPSVSSEVKLTPRQKQILLLIKERGASNKVIAKTLNITESTVKLHVSIVLRKFGVKNRTQLALFSK
jgi:DNA-binding NarL/FixJ family response regulator